MPFQPGHPGGPGRPKGSKNYASLSVNPTPVGRNSTQGRSTHDGSVRRRGRPKKVSESTLVDATLSIRQWLDELPGMEMAEFHREYAPQYDENWRREDEERLGDLYERSHLCASVDRVEPDSAQALVWRISLRIFRMDPLKLFRVSLSMQGDSEVPVDPSFFERLARLITHPFFASDSSGNTLRMALEWAIICRTRSPGAVPLNPTSCRLIGKLRPSQLKPSGRVGDTTWEWFKNIMQRGRDEGIRVSTEARLLEAIGLAVADDRQGEHRGNALTAGDLLIVISALDHLARDWRCCMISTDTAYQMFMKEWDGRDFTSEEEFGVVHTRSWLAYFRMRMTINRRGWQKHDHEAYLEDDWSCLGLVPIDGDVDEVSEAEESESSWGGFDDDSGFQAGSGLDEPMEDMEPPQSTPEPTPEPIQQEPDLELLTPPSTKRLVDALPPRSKRKTYETRGSEPARKRRAVVDEASGGLHPLVISSDEETDLDSDGSEPGLDAEPIRKPGLDAESLRNESGTTVVSPGRTMTDVSSRRGLDDLFEETGSETDEEGMMTLGTTMESLAAPKDTSLPPGQKAPSEAGPEEGEVRESRRGPSPPSPAQEGLEEGEVREGGEDTNLPSAGQAEPGEGQSKVVSAQDSTELLRAYELHPPFKRSNFKRESRAYLPLDQSVLRTLG